MNNQITIAVNMMDKYIGEVFREIFMLQAFGAILRIGIEINAVEIFKYI